MTKIAVIGTGYVGSTTGACFAHMGHEVVCADIDSAKVDSLRRGVIPIVELGFQELVVEGLAGGRLSFVLGAADAAADLRDRLPVRPDSARRGRFGRPELHRSRCATDRAGTPVRGSRRQQVDGAGRQREGRRAGDGTSRRQGRLEPRVPA